LDLEVTCQIRKVSPLFCDYIKIVFFLIFSFLGVALSPWEAIGSVGVRNFMLCKKKPEEKKVEEDKGRSNFPINGARKGAGGSFKAWINKSLRLKVTTH